MGVFCSTYRLRILEQHGRKAPGNLWCFKNPRAYVYMFLLLVDVICQISVYHMFGKIFVQKYIVRFFSWMLPEASIIFVHVFMNLHKSTPICIMFTSILLTPIYVSLHQFTSSLHHLLSPFYWWTATMLRGAGNTVLQVFCWFYS